MRAEKSRCQLLAEVEVPGGACGSVQAQRELYQGNTSLSGL